MISEGCNLPYVSRITLESAYCGSLLRKPQGVLSPSSISLTCKHDRQRFGPYSILEVDPRDLLSCVVEIAACFASSFHAFREIDTGFLQPPRRQRLKFGELSLFGV